MSYLIARQSRVVERATACTKARLSFASMLREIWWRFGTPSRKSSNEAGWMLRRRPATTRSPSAQQACSDLGQTFYLRLDTGCRLSLEGQTRGLVLADIEELLSSSKLGHRLLWAMSDIRLI